ncbi:MAG: nuclear transport factor 2 family protein [Mycobacterium sp.]
MTSTETAKAFYELFASGRIEELIGRFVDADSVLDNPLPDAIPFGGQFAGPAGFAAYAQAIAAAIDIEQFEIDEILAQADRVVVLGRETSRVRNTDRRYTMAWVHVLTVRDGRVLRLREYNDTGAMDAAFA